jgi:hypothetical protein
MWNFFREDHKLRAFEKEVLRRVFGAKRNYITKD